MNYGLHGGRLCESGRKKSITERPGLQRRKERGVIVENGDNDRARLRADFRQGADQFESAGI